MKILILLLLLCVGCASDPNAWCKKWRIIRSHAGSPLDSECIEINKDFE